MKALCALATRSAEIRGRHVPVDLGRRKDLLLSHWLSATLFSASNTGENQVRIHPKSDSFLDFSPSIPPDYEG